MLKVKAQTNVRNARAYFREHLTVGDYYCERQTVPGEWLGQGATALGLSGNVGEEAFLSLCNGRHPKTADRLTLRLNSTRREKNKITANRRAFFDFTISPPKSVSVLALCQDARIVDLHNRAVRTAMTELEKFAETRVRKARQRGARPTGQIVAACFRHDTSRELDPHLHTHCVVFNATFDPVEKRWKALEPHGMFRAQRFAENYYYHELCKVLRTLGYEIEPKHRDFEIKGVPRKVIDCFSKRNLQILVESTNWIAQGRGYGNKKDIQEQVAHGIRRRKLPESTAEHLRGSWIEQLGPLNCDNLRTLPFAWAAKPEALDLQEVLAWAEEHTFERNAVASEHQLLAAALARGRGQDFSLDQLREAVRQTPNLLTLDKGEVTSRELVRMESELVHIALHKPSAGNPINLKFEPDRRLSEEQRGAVRHIMFSHFAITILRGGAGTGKTTALREVQRGAVEAKCPIIVLAPQWQQVDDLIKDGFPAKTLASFLADPKLPDKALVILDEAGQVGIRDLHRLVTLAVKKADTHLILSGDTRQHGAVAASDALVLLERNGYMRALELTTIRRQDPGLAKTQRGRNEIARYRSAVYFAARENPRQSFDVLNHMGWIREHRPEEGRALLAQHYLSALDRREKALVVAQTWNEVHAVNSAVRVALRDAGRLGVGTELKTYHAVDLTLAQKKDPSSYAPGAQVLFLKRYGRYRRGEICLVDAVTPKGVTLVKNGRTGTVGYGHADRLTVLHERPLEIAAGDRLQTKWNGRSIDGQRIVNGELLTVREVHPDGTISVENDRGERKDLGPDQRVFHHGYAVTSYAAQGKTVDRVLFSDSGSLAATNKRQWYVTISRARRGILVFTPDKEALRDAIGADGDRRLAFEGKKDGRPVSEQLKEAQHRRIAPAHDPYENFRIPSHGQGVRTGIGI
jgi:conjugative relaxase-like TrwC/TraI family protein